MSDSSVLFDLPGPRARVRYRITAVVSAVALLTLLGLILLRFDDKEQLTAAKWDWALDPVAWTSYLLPGLRATLTAAVLAIVISMVLALVLALARMSEHRLISWPATVIVEFFRGVPVLIMMIFTFYLLVEMGWFPNDINPLIGTVTGLVLYNASVLAEVIRNGVKSLPAGQSEAGLSIGLSGFQTRRMILLPQSLTAMLPTLVSQLVVITKDSALGYMILYPELVTAARRIASWTSAVLPAYLIVAIIFILINYGIDRLARMLEKRMRERGRTSGPVQGAAGTINLGEGEPVEAASANPR